MPDSVLQGGCKRCIAAYTNCIWHARAGAAAAKATHATVHLASCAVAERNEPLTMPLGPSVDLTRSVIAMAPTKAACKVHELIQRGLLQSAACALCSRKHGGKVVFHTSVPCVRLIPCPPWPLLVKHLAVAPSAVRGANTGPTFSCCLWAPSACCCMC